MPADRSKAHNDRRREEVQQLVWTVPVEPATVDAEGPAVLSGPAAFDFDDGPPPLVDRDLIFCPADDDLIIAPRKVPHSKKKPEDHIPRPPNAFILFRSAFIRGQHVSTEVETNHSTLSKIIGLTWKNLPNEERMFWHAKARIALDEHKRKFPQYSFRPSVNKVKAPGGKRKVREVGPKDPVRCAKIAELLVEGKKGQELDAAILEFDKHHVPQVITRFEKPLTAGMYLRSCSAPVPDAEVVKDEEQERQNNAKKSRSASTQPNTPFAPPSRPAPLEISLPQQVVEPPVSVSFDQHFVLPPQHSPTFEPPSYCFNPQAATYCEMPQTDQRNIVYQDSIMDLNRPSPLEATTPTICTTTPSFLTVDDWSSGCSSPLSSPSSISSSSPATPPPYMESSFETSYSPFSLDSLESSLAKSFGVVADYSPYEYMAPDHGAAVGGGITPNGCFTAYEQFPEPFTINNVTINLPVAQTHMTRGRDLDFSVFVGGMPQYAI